MNTSLVRRSVFLVLAASAVWSCGASTPARGGAKSVDAEFDRCREEEEHGEAKGCWNHFLDNFRNLASTAQVMVAEDHLRGTDRKATDAAQKAPEALPNPANAPEGVIVTGAKGSQPPAPDVSPQPATASPRDCYRGIELSGNAQRDLDT
jgi:hypothetical protein